MLVITLGDPLSISLECLCQLEDLWGKSNPGPVVLVGSYAQWLWQARELAWSAPKVKIISHWGEVKPGAQASAYSGLYFLDIDSGATEQSPTTLSVGARGQISVKSLESLRGLQAQSDQTPDFRLAVVTSPIDKFVASKAGFSFPGQTEFFCDLWKSQGIMILAGSKLRVALATNHVKLSDVTALISEELICQKLSAFDQSLKDVLGIKKPRIAVAALNPHAGDQGMFGDEDRQIIAPAVKIMQSRGLDVVGPKPADTIFFQAYNGQYDGVLAMYHDQGLGPLKSLHFYDAVNISGGLPHLRISPDHGPAGELYGKKLAKEDSFRLSLIHARNYLGW